MPLNENGEKVNQRKQNGVAGVCVCVVLPIKLCHAMVLNMYYLELERRVLSVCRCVRYSEKWQGSKGAWVCRRRHTIELVATSKTTSMIMTLGWLLSAAAGHQIALLERLCFGETLLFQNKLS